MTRRSQTIECAQCGQTATGKAAGWRGCRTDDLELEEPPSVAFFCELCALEEFGRLGKHRSSDGDAV